MNLNTINVLEYNKIIEILKGYALSDMAKEQIEKLEPYVDINEVERNMLETTEARKIADITTSIPLHGLTGLKAVFDKLNKNYNLLPEEFESICGFLRDGKKLKKFMKDKADCAPTISNFALSIYELDELIEEIERCIAQGRVIDKASPELARVRKKLVILDERIKSKIESVLKNPKYKNYLQDNLVSVRNGRYVLPVKSQYKNEIAGSVHDSSSSGSTVFIEPVEVKKAQDEINALKIEEENEVYRILSALTALVENYYREIHINMETMAYYDFLFAKAKYSKAIDAKAVSFNSSNQIIIKNGRHPLIGKNVVPLNFSIGEDYKALIITGPNTGGKTVALKTIGLLSMMAQAGLQVPVDEGSVFAIFADVLADIGDGQSIEQNLSTFSSHIKNIISIIECADPYTLVIIDEVGAGTDPGEGMGIAAAVLEKIYNKGATILATTHYSEIKEFAAKNDGFINGSMEFDINTLKPTYRLKIGVAGESNAFLIALKLGMDKKLIEKAHFYTYKEEKEYNILENLTADNLPEKKLVDMNYIEAHEENIEKIKEQKRLNKLSEKEKQEPRFKLGDCVYISFMNRTGIVCELENAKGEVGVMVMKKKFKINQKRLSLYIESDELYPEDYDFDIVFESKDNRKKKHIMNKKHVEGMEIETK